MSNRPTRIEQLRHHPSGVLLVVLLFGLLVYPVVGDRTFGRALLGVLGVVVLGLAVMAVRRTPALTWVAALLGLPVVVLTVRNLVLIALFAWMVGRVARLPAPVRADADARSPA